MKEERLKTKLLNALVMGKNFTNKSIDEYIYASLSQPPIKIIDKCGSDDELDYIVECPNCGNHICYGTDTFMYAGHIYCSNSGCKEEVEKSMKWGMEIEIRSRNVCKI